MQKLKVHPGGISVMSPKFRYFQMHLEQVDNRAAAIINQEMLSLGGEAILSEEVSRFQLGHSRILLLGTEKIFMKLIQIIRILMEILFPMVLMLFRLIPQHRWIRMVTIILTPGTPVCQNKTLLQA